MNEELKDLVCRLLDEFDVRNGFPSTYIMTEDGPLHGMVSDSVADIIEQMLDVLGDEYD